MLQRKNYTSVLLFINKLFPQKRSIFFHAILFISKGHCHNDSYGGAVALSSQDLPQDANLESGDHSGGNKGAQTASLHL